ncbi:hypothetical protein ACFPM0_37115 [Pseudonocardia sulfidoxydans]|uniref:hypothetical protein n=1 Tax=Pseudonocardia sulfidoxydans TaxID=54011 RepID=UPI0036198495
MGGGAARPAAGHLPRPLRSRQRPVVHAAALWGAAGCCWGGLPLMAAAGQETADGPAFGGAVGLPALKLEHGLPQRKGRYASPAATALRAALDVEPPRPSDRRFAVAGTTPATRPGPTDPPPHTQRPAREGHLR